MAGTGMTFGAASFNRAVGKALDQAGSTKALMADIGEALVSSTRQRFKDEKGAGRRGLEAFRPGRSRRRPDPD